MQNYATFFSGTQLSLETREHLMTLADWSKKGFARPPELRRASGNGVMIYRAWGGASTEWGSGYFSIDKPKSVLDAELRFNIADWGNQIHFLTTFRLKPGFAYYQGPVAHGARDISLPADQVLLNSPFVAMVEKLGAFEILRHDVFVSPRGGIA